MIRTHPVTGRRAPYVNEEFAVGMVDVDESESEEILRSVWAKVAEPALQYRLQ